jgi:hypothetical protein
MSKNIIDVRGDDVVHHLAAITVEVTSLGIEMALVFATLEVIVPIGVIGDGTIQYSGIPSEVGGERDMWEFREFFIREGTHPEINQSVNDVKGEHVSFQGGDRLSATDTK